MAIRAKMLRKKPIASHPTTAVPRNPFLNDMIAQAIEQPTLTNSTNSQLAGSIKTIENRRFWVDETVPPIYAKTGKLTKSSNIFAGLLQRPRLPNTPTSDFPSLRGAQRRGNPSDLLATRR